MRDTDLFQLALGLTPPWEVVSCDFDPQQRRLDIRLGFPRGSMFACPECGQMGLKAHDTVEKTWRHLNFFQHEAYLSAKVPRVKCDKCGVKLLPVPWARPGSGFTLLFEAMIMALVKAMPVKTVAAYVGEHDTRLWRILHHYVDQARERVDLSNITRFGVDETASKRGHNYVSLFVHLEDRKVIFATEGKDSSVIKRFNQDFLAHGGSPAHVEEACCDMSKAFISGIKEHFPGAQITFDKFHIMKIINEAVDEVRRNEQRDHPELSKTRYVWLKNPTNLKAKQVEHLKELSLPKLNLKTVRAYHLKLNFQELFTKSKEEAELYLKKWYFWATHSRLEPIKKAAATIKRHWDGILRWFTSGVNNGILEGLNSLIQSAKSKARGYRTTKNLIAMIYLIGGRLKFTLPT
jgi:transposase